MANLKKLGFYELLVSWFVHEVMRLIFCFLSSKYSTNPEYMSYFFGDGFWCFIRRPYNLLIVLAEFENSITLLLEVIKNLGCWRLRRCQLLRGWISWNPAGSPPNINEKAAGTASKPCGTMTILKIYTLFLPLLFLRVKSLILRPNSKMNLSFKISKSSHIEND